MIFDTDVLIWYLRGNAAARVLVESSIPFQISSVTHMELLQGMRDRTELRRFQKTIKSWNLKVIHIDQEISARAVFYVQEYSLTHSMKLADALIAATAVQSSEVLVTANDKHYKFIPNLEIQRFAVDG